MKEKMIFIALMLLGTHFIVGQEISVTIKKAELNCRQNGAGPQAESLVVEFDKSVRSMVQDIEGGWDYTLNNSTNSILVSCANPDDEFEKSYCPVFDLIKDLVNPEHYYLIEVDSRNVFQFSSLASPASIDGEIDKILNLPTVRSAEPTPVEIASFPTLQNTVKLNFPSPNSIDLNKTLVLIAKYTDTKKSVPVMTKVEMSSNCESVDETLPEPEKADQTSGSTDKKKNDVVSFVKDIKENEDTDSSVWDFEFSLAGGKKKKSVYSFKSDFRPFQRRRFGLGGYYDWTYFFMETEVKINSSESDRKNVLNLGTEFSLNGVFHKDGNRFQTIENSRSRFPGWMLTYTPKLETEWGFKERNLVPINFRGTLPINVYQSQRTTVRLDPFIGFESGYIWRSENSKPGWNIARPFVGADFTFGFLRKDKNPLGLFEIKYIRRFLLKPELSYGIVETKEVADGFSRKPRDHATAKFTINYGPISPFFEYEYGRLPPRYIFQNHIFKSGLKLNVDFFWKKDQ